MLFRPNSLCKLDFLKSKSKTITFLSACAMIFAKFADIVVFPSPETEEVIEIIWLLLCLGKNCRFVRIALYDSSISLAAFLVLLFGRIP